MGKNFKIVCMSDSHGNHDKVDLPEGDLLIYAGDLTSGGTSRQVVSFLKWIRVMSNRFTHGAVYIAGNHDKSYDLKYALDFEAQPELNKGDKLPIWLRAAMSNYKSNHLHYLQDSGVDIEGLKIWGSPITPWFYGDVMAFNAHRGEQIKEYWDKIPEGIDVLVTHGPPAGILDYMSDKNINVGCYDLKVRVEKIKPKLHVFGHIHDGYGILKENGTIYVNASVLDRHYTLRNKPIVINIEI